MLRAAACGAVRVLLPAVAAWTSSVVIVRGVRRRVCIFETPDVCSGVQHSSIHSIHVMCKVFSNPCHYNFADTHPTMAARIFSSAAHGAVRFGGGASRRVHTARRWLSTTRAARPRRVAAVLDIDGVCMLGQQVLPGVPDALQRLYGAGVPTLFATNGGGVVEAEKAANLEHALGTPVGAHQIILCHTPTRQLVERYATRGGAGRCGVSHDIVWRRRQVCGAQSSVRGLASGCGGGKGVRLLARGRREGCDSRGPEHIPAACTSIHRHIARDAVRGGAELCRGACCGVRVPNMSHALRTCTCARPGYRLP